MAERAAPLRRLLHGWMADRGLLLVHGGAVGFPDGGILLTGREGAGKSIAALACLRSPLGYAADDYCLLRVSPDPWVHSVYSTGKTHASDVARLPFLAPMFSNPNSVQHEKALYFLQRHVPNKLTPGFPLRAVLVPRVTGEPETTLALVQRGTVLRALAPTTVLLSPQTAGGTLPALAVIARRVPVFELRVGTDSDGAPRTIINLLTALRAARSPAADARIFRDGLLA